VATRAVLDPRAPFGTRADAFDQMVTPIAQRLIDATHRITELNRENLTSTQGEAQTLARNALYALHVLTATAVVIAATFALAIGRVILGPLGALTRSVREIHQGNLDAAVPVRTRDELGQLAAAFNEMAEQLRVFRRIDHEKLMRTQRTTQLAIDSLPDPVIVLNSDGRIELTNDAGRRWFGLTPGDAIDLKAMPWLRDALRRTSDSSSPQPETASGYDTTVHVEHDGDERHLLPRAVPIRDEDGHVIGATVVLNDVTGLRRLDQMKSGLLSLVSHELKTPLTSMRMILHLVVQERIAPLDRQLRDLLVTARDESDRLHLTVENLLDMGRIESGKVLMELKPITVGELLDRSVEPLRPTVEEHGLRLAVDHGPTDQRTVQADATRIGHVMANLIGNALRYTPAGGSITISTRCDADGSPIEFSVTDTGCGIPPQFLPRVFEKFFRVPDQAPAQRNGGGGGAGLGLAIVRDIIEAHGGHITATSTPGHGTAFRFTLNPVSQPTPTHPAGTGV
jgi:PAS domain S-box-containing protein